MESIKEIKEKILANVRYRDSLPCIGGQMVNYYPRGIELISEDMDFHLTIGINRSRMKNKELALTLFELYLDEVIRP